MFDGTATVHARLEFGFFVTSHPSSRVVEVIDALALPIPRACDLPDVEVYPGKFTKVTQVSPI